MAGLRLGLARAEGAVDLYEFEQSARIAGQVDYKIDCTTYIRPNKLVLTPALQQLRSFQGA